MAERSNIQFERKNPGERELPKEERRHTIDIFLDGEWAGNAELVYFGKPIPVLYLDFMGLREQERFRGKKLGSAMIEQVNAYIKERGKMGVLFDEIDERASGMYERHGWTKSDLPGISVFNLPKSAKSEDVRATIVRIAKWVHEVEIPYQNRLEAEEEQAAK